MVSETKRPPLPPAGAASHSADYRERNDRENIRHMAALGRHPVHLLVGEARRKEVLRSAFTLADELVGWHRRCEPRLYAREAGARP